MARGAVRSSSEKRGEKREEKAQPPRGGGTGKHLQKGDAEDCGVRNGMSRPNVEGSGVTSTERGSRKVVTSNVGNQKKKSVHRSSLVYPRMAGSDSVQNGDGMGR